MTPAQATDRPNFVTDVATQGPTDAGQRAAACAWAAALITGGVCVDCGGPVPAWARTTGLAGIGERVERFGRPICCLT